MERLFKRCKGRAGLVLLMLLVLNLVFIQMFLLSYILISSHTNLLADKINKTFEIEQTSYSIELEKNLKNFYIDSLNATSIDFEENNELYSNGTTNIKFIEKANRVSFAKLKLNIEKILGEDKDLHGIYVYDLERKQETGVNEKTVYPPASISKVPIVMNVLKDVDEGKLKLDQKVRIQSNDYVHPSNILYLGDIGKEYTLEQLIDWAIVDSDNISLTALERVFGGNDKSNQYTREKMQIDPFYRLPHTATPENVGKVFELIYNQEYLSKESNEVILKYLKNTAEWLQEEIPAGLPEDTVIAHKTGRVVTEYGLTLEDAGIVYGEDVDYIIVFLNRDIETESAREKITAISKLVYDTLN